MRKQKTKTSLGALILTSAAFLFILNLLIIWAVSADAAEKNGMVKKETKKESRGPTLRKMNTSPRGTVPTGGVDVTVGKWILKAANAEIKGVQTICFDLKLDPKNSTQLNSTHFAGAAKILVDGTALYSTVLTASHIDGVCNEYPLSKPVDIPANSGKEFELVISLTAGAPHGARFTPLFGIKTISTRTFSANPLSVSALPLSRAPTAPVGGVPSGGTNVILGQWVVKTSATQLSVKKICFDLNPNPNNVVQLQSSHFTGLARILLDNQEIFSVPLDASHFNRRCEYASLSAAQTFSTGTSRQIDLWVDLDLTAPHGARLTPILGLEGSFPVSLATNPLTVSALALRKSPASRGGSMLSGTKSASVGEWTLAAAASEVNDIKNICFDLKLNLSSPSPLAAKHFSGKLRVLIDGVTIYLTDLNVNHTDGNCEYVTLGTPLQFAPNTSKRLELLVDVSSSAPQYAQFTPILGVSGAYPETAQGNELMIDALVLNKAKTSPSGSVPSGGVDVTVGEWAVSSNSTVIVNISPIQRICFDLNPADKTKLMSNHFSGQAKVLVDGVLVYSAPVDRTHVDGECQFSVLQTFFNLETGIPKTISLMVSLDPKGPTGAKFTPLLGVEGALPGNIAANERSIR